MSDALDNAIWAVNSAQTSVNIPTPTGQLRMVLTGNLPASSTDSTNMLCAVMQGENLLFRCAASVSWQGQSSVNNPKHNLNLKLTNETTGDDFYVKVGSWVPDKKIDLKAYGDQSYDVSGNFDRSMIRDTTAAKLWRSIRHASFFPDSLIAPFSALAYDSAVNNGVNSGALFSTEGYPCSVYLNGVFYGLYVYRSTASNDDYLIHGENPNHYLLQPEHIKGTPDAQNGYNGSWFDFDSKGWKISSPKLKKYNDGDDISSKFPEQYAVINRLFTYFGNVYSGSDTLTNADQYINVNSWIDYIIFCEVAGSNDAWLNNVMLVSWNATATSGIWNVCAYDLDETFGIIYGGYAQMSSTTPSGMGICCGSVVGQGIFYLISEHFNDMKISRYAQLRNSGVISIENIWKIICESTDIMNVQDVAQDVTLWGTNDQSSPAYIYNWIQGRIAWLDEQWGYTSK